MVDVGKSNSGSACSLTSIHGGFLPGDGSWHGLHALNGVPSQAIVSVRSGAVASLPPQSATPTKKKEKVAMSLPKASQCWRIPDELWAIRATLIASAQAAPVGLPSSSG